MSTSFTPEERLKCKAIFDKFDLDKNGVISKSELGNAMKLQGVALNENELEDLLNSIDTDHDHVVNFEEFLEFIF